MLERAFDSERELRFRGGDERELHPSRQDHVDHFAPERELQRQEFRAEPDGFSECFG